MSEKAANVIEALSRVMVELPGIGKDQQAAAQQGGYAYRGIEQITQHVQPLLAKHGVVFVPHVHSYEVRDLTVNNKPWTDTFALVSYTVYGPGGVEDKIEVGPLLAIGRDNSDKGANKCATQAFKYALLQTFCIADAKDDGDAVSHAADGQEQVAALDGWADIDEQDKAHADFRETVAACSEDVQGHVRDYRKDRGFPWPMPRVQLDEMCEALSNAQTVLTDEDEDKRLERAIEVADENGLVERAEALRAKQRERDGAKKDPALAAAGERS